MASIADKIVTAKAGTVVAENLKLALTTAGGGGSSLTPSVLTAMVGISSNQALQEAAEVTEAKTILQTHASMMSPNVAGYVPGVSGPGNAAASALSSLTSYQSEIGMGASPSHAKFGMVLSQAKGHIDDSVELKKATNFISNSSFEDFGSGVTNIQSMATQGISNVFGDLGATANVLDKVGPCFDLSKPSELGTGAGFVNKLNISKLGNFTGVNEALAKNNADLEDITDPVYVDTVTNTLSSITDPVAIKTIVTDLEVTPIDTIRNLNDFTLVNKFVPTADTASVSATLPGIGEKFKDLGASFPSVASVGTMLRNLEVPDIPTLNAVPSLDTLVGGMQSQLDGLTGIGTGELGMPGLDDFFESVKGGPSITALLANVSVASVSGISSMVSGATTLLSKAGIAGLDTGSSLSGSINFATNLHKFGQDSGVSSLLQTIAKPNSQFGDAIKLSLAEGKNQALMSKYGIQPLNFKG
jgi:hypothetical protein